MMGPSWRYSSGTCVVGFVGGITGITLVLPPSSSKSKGKIPGDNSV